MRIDLGSGLERIVCEPTSKICPLNRCVCERNNCAWWINGCVVIAFIQKLMEVMDYGRKGY